MWQKIRAWVRIPASWDGSPTALPLYTDYDEARAGAKPGDAIRYVGDREQIVWWGSDKPDDFDKWEIALETAFGHPILVVLDPVGGGRWRVSQATIEDKDMRDEVKAASAKAGLPVE